MYISYSKVIIVWIGSYACVHVYVCVNVKDSWFVACIQTPNTEMYCLARFTSARLQYNSASHSDFKLYWMTWYWQSEKHFILYFYHKLFGWLVGWLDECTYARAYISCNGFTINAKSKLNPSRRPSQQWFYRLVYVLSAVCLLHYYSCLYLDFVELAKDREMTSSSWANACKHNQPHFGLFVGSVSFFISHWRNTYIN